MHHANPGRCPGYRPKRSSRHPVATPQAKKNRPGGAAKARWRRIAHASSVNRRQRSKCSRPIDAPVGARSGNPAGRAKAGQRSKQLYSNKFISKRRATWLQRLPGMPCTMPQRCSCSVPFRGPRSVPDPFACLSPNPKHVACQPQPSRPEYLLSHCFIDILISLFRESPVLYFGSFVGLAATSVSYTTHHVRSTPREAAGNGVGTGPAV